VRSRNNKRVKTSSKFNPYSTGGPLVTKRKSVRRRFKNSSFINKPNPALFDVSKLMKNSYKTKRNSSIDSNISTLRIF
jgi:hypothetical protein